MKYFLLLYFCTAYTLDKKSEFIVFKFVFIKETDQVQFSACKGFLL